MGAADTIQKAIEKLGRLRDERGYEEYEGWLVEAFVGEPSPVTNDEMFLVLHRTIDAQLAILADARLRDALGQAFANPVDERQSRNALALAEAILRES